MYVSFTYLKNLTVKSFDHNKVLEKIKRERVAILDLLRIFKTIKNTVREYHMNLLIIFKINIPVDKLNLYRENLICGLIWPEN